MASSKPIPITIISGFLGAGKTTLLNNILHSCQGTRIAMLLNDFGSTNIDAGLIASTDARIVSLANGCICCSIRSQFQNALINLVNQTEPPERILIETSGVANPEEVAQNLNPPGMSREIYLDAIITIIDAEQTLGLTGEIARLGNIQITAADLLLLNKVDLVTAKQLFSIHSWLRKLKPRTPVLNVTYARAPLEVILPMETHIEKKELLAVVGNIQSPAYQTSSKAINGISQHHEFVFDTWVYTNTVPIRLEALQRVLLRLTEKIYRVKGFLYLVERPETKFFLQKVGQRVAVTEDRNWTDIPQTRLEFIGASGEIDVISLQEELDECEAPSSV